MKKSWFVLAAAALLPLTGCYNYEGPANDFTASSFTERDRTETDQLLSEIKELTIADAQKICLLNNPDYISAFHSVNAARMRYYQSFASYSPTITINGGYSAERDDYWHMHEIYADYEDTNSDQWTIGLNAQLVVFDGLAREFGVMIAKHSYGSARALSDDARRKLLFSVSNAYYQVLLAAAQRRIALEDMSYQLKNLRETGVKNQYGAVPMSDVLNFQIQVNTADSNRLSAEYNYAIAVYALAALMGYPEGTLPENITFPEIQYETDELLLGVDTYLDMALANRPDLKSYREQLKVSEYTLYQKYSAWSPVVTANVGLAINRDQHNIYTTDENIHRSYNQGVLTYGMSASWVVFDGFSRFNKVREAEANLAISKYTVASAWLTVVNDVRTAYANYDQNIKQANLYSEIRKLVFKQRDLVQVEFDAGQAEITRLNEAQRNVVEAEGNLVQALANVQIARAQLESAANINNLGLHLYGESGPAYTKQLLQQEKESAAEAAPAANEAPKGDAAPAAAAPAEEIVGPQRPVAPAAQPAR